MAFDEKLAERIRGLVAGNDAVTEKKMFGGVAFMVGGNMFVGIVKDELMVRTGPKAYEDALARPYARPMEFTGRPMRGMVFVGTEGFAKDSDFREWVECGLSFASSLPPKKK